MRQGGIRVQRGYVTGLMTGAVLGGVLAIWLAPQFNGNAPGRLKDGSRRLGRRAQHWWRYGRDAAEDMMDGM